MKNIKKIIPILIIFLTIGFAAVNYTLSLDGDANLTGDLEDFKVYFSRVLINGVEDNSIVTSATTLSFSNKLTTIGEEYTIDYDVTNGSTYFDAAITLDCTEGNEYLSVTNTFDTSNLTSLETRSGKLVLKRLKSLASSESKFNEITCTITATPIERETLGEGTITNPVNPYYIGREVSIGTEKFNIISEEENTITMLAQYNLGTDYKQSTENNNVTFSETEGWEYTPGPKEIDIYIWSAEISEMVTNYVSYLKDTTNDKNIKGDLITFNALGSLGCKVSENYSWNSGGWNCEESANKEWIVNGQRWWTKSAGSDDYDNIWMMETDGYLYDYTHTHMYNGVRPTITISKKTAQLLLKTYRVGQEISIGDELFNVISDNGTTISMLARYNINSEYKQSASSYKVTFAESNGWEYTPAPKEIDIQTWTTNPKNLVNGYTSYLKTLNNAKSIKGDLVTLTEMEKLGCTIPANYTEYSISNSCQNSPHSNWIITDQEWWTRSADPADIITVWKIMHNSKFYGGHGTNEVSGVRPVITISKDGL